MESGEGGGGGDELEGNDRAKLANGSERAKGE